LSAALVRATSSLMLEGRSAVATTPKSSIALGVSFMASRARPGNGRRMPFRPGGPTPRISLAVHQRLADHRRLNSSSNSFLVQPLFQRRTRTEPFGCRRSLSIRREIRSPANSIRPRPDSYGTDLFVRLKSMPMVVCKSPFRTPRAPLFPIPRASVRATSMQA